MPNTQPPLTWDIFCQVVDNHGDLGVCWRLSRELAARGQTVRLWVDDAAALQWMAPHAMMGGVPGVQVLAWTTPINAARLRTLPAADIWIEAFGCTIDPEFIAHYAHLLSTDGRSGPTRRPIWINLEYLSAEPYVERMHALPSPVQHGPAAGWTKWFFYPGFTPQTGGLIRERDLAVRQAAFDRAGWLSAQGIAWRGEPLASLFCYEPDALAAWLQNPHRPRCLVTAGRATQAVRRLLDTEAARSSGHAQHPPPASYLPALSQTAYDELLWACDLNFVRGEDSLVRALWAGQALVWQLYPQQDDAHHAKLEAFLDWLDAPAALRQFHRRWNGVSQEPLPEPDLNEWRSCVRDARRRLLAQEDLCTQLLRYVVEKR